MSLRKVIPMARFRTEGLDEIIEQMDKMEQSTGELADRMLFAGAEEVRLAWRKAAKLHGLIDTGEMFDSIGYPRRPKIINNVKSIDIYPQGYSKITSDGDGKTIKRKQKVRNAEKAFVLHYGTSKRPGSYWVDTADDLAGPQVEERLSEIFTDWLRDNGFL